MYKTGEKISNYLGEITDYPYIHEVKVEVNKVWDEVKIKHYCFEITIKLYDFDVSTTEGCGMDIPDIEFVKDIIDHLDEIKEILEGSIRND